MIGAHDARRRCRQEDRGGVRSRALLSPPFEAFLDSRPTAGEGCTECSMDPLFHPSSSPTPRCRPCDVAGKASSAIVVRQCVLIRPASGAPESTPQTAFTCANTNGGGAGKHKCPTSSKAQQ